MKLDVDRKEKENIINIKRIIMRKIGYILLIALVILPGLLFAQSASGKRGENSKSEEFSKQNQQATKDHSISNVLRNFFSSDEYVEDKEEENEFDYFMDQDSNGIDDRLQKVKIENKSSTELIKYPNKIEENKTNTPEKTDTKAKPVSKIDDETQESDKEDKVRTKSHRTK